MPHDIDDASLATLLAELRDPADAASSSVTDAQRVAWIRRVAR